MKALSLFAALVCTARLAAEPVKLFNGTGLEGWSVKGADYWTATAGVLKGESDDKQLASTLWTDASYKDFTLELEFRFSGDIDSGIFLRHENEQIQIGTSRSLRRDMTGSPYIGSLGKYPQEAKGVKEALKPDDWNIMKIVVKGNTYIVSLNGTQVIEYVSATAKESGPVGLQIHAQVTMKIEFRNLSLEPLE